MEKMKKIIDTGGELIEKAKPVVEKAAKKTIETVGALKEFGKNTLEKISTKTSSLIESGKNLYSTITKSVDADPKLIKETEKETKTTKKLKNIWNKASELAVHTKEKISNVLGNEIGAAGIDINEDSSKQEEVVLERKIPETYAEVQEQHEADLKRAMEEIRKRDLKHEDDLKEARKAYEYHDPADGFKERVEEANRKSQNKFDALPEEEKAKIKPIDLPWTEKIKRVNEQHEAEMEQAHKGEWDPSKSKFDNTFDSWKNLGIDPESASKRATEIRKAAREGKEKKEATERAKQKEEFYKKYGSSKLDEIQSEKKQKQESEKQEADSKFVAEEMLAKEGKWKPIDSCFFSKLSQHEKYDALEKINKEAIEKSRRIKVEARFTQEKKLAEEGKWDKIKSSFKNYGFNKEEAQKAEELNRINLHATEAEGEKVYSTEEEKAKKGEWNASDSFFYKKWMFESTKLSDELKKKFEEQYKKLKGINTAEKAKKAEEERKKRDEEFKKQRKQSQYRRRPEENMNASAFEERQTMQILKLDPNGLSEKILKSAYRKFAKENHPDIVNSQNLSDVEKNKKEELMKIVSSGYETLLKKIKNSPK